jgi:hypothetical protein
MDRERLDYADPDRPPKRRVFSTADKIALGVAIALALAMLLPELYWWLWPGVRPRQLAPARVGILRGMSPKCGRA